VADLAITGTTLQSSVIRLPQAKWSYIQLKHVANSPKSHNLNKDKVNTSVVNGKHMMFSGVLFYSKEVTDINIFQW
jgi:hypothetical protein